MMKIKAGTHKFYVFHKVKPDEVPDILIREDKHFDDAIFEFVYHELGYAMLEIESDSPITVKKV